MIDYAYYNEFDPYAAQWLRNLIAAGHIAPGDVDERSITDVPVTDLIGYTQCHFFAGIGGWSLAARLAGWPDARPLWTGSCPCQPFSVAGKGAGQDDARHLWPDFFRLIRAARPDVVMGEQVAAAVGKNWLDGVLADLEGIGYVGGRPLSRLVPSTPRTVEIDSGSSLELAYWVTASARDWKDSPGMSLAPRKDGTSRIDLLPRQVYAAMWSTPTSLAPAKDGNNEAGNSAGLVSIRAHAMAAMWSTPRASDGEKGGPNQSFGAGGQPLPAQAFQTAMWPTAQARDHRIGMPERYQGGQSLNGKRSNLNDAAARHGLTPAGSSATMEKPGALAPEFVGWLMGFPQAWLDGAPEKNPTPRFKKKSK